MCGQRKVTKRKAPPANPTATRLPSGQVQGRTDRRRRHIPVPAASAPSSLMALLTLPLPFCGLEWRQVTCFALASLFSFFTTKGIFICLSYLLLTLTLCKNSVSSDLRDLHCVFYYLLNVLSRCFHLEIRRLSNDIYNKGETDEF